MAKGRVILSHKEVKDFDEKKWIKFTETKYYVEDVGKQMGWVGRTGVGTP